MAPLCLANLRNHNLLKSLTLFSGQPLSDAGTGVPPAHVQARPGPPSARRLCGRREAGGPRFRTERVQPGQHAQATPSALRHRRQGVIRCLACSFRDPSPASTRHSLHPLTQVNDSQQTVYDTVSKEWIAARRCLYDHFYMCPEPTSATPPRYTGRCRSGAMGLMGSRNDHRSLYIQPGWAADRP